MTTVDTLKHEYGGSTLSGMENMSRSQSPTRMTRHAKGLSLSFPILLPTQQPSGTSSPTTTSPTNAIATASPRLRPRPAPSAQEPVQSASRTSADFLTLVAAQERKVLEIREELAKADAELTALKKQWAIYEANKKRDEVRHVRRMAVRLDQVPSPTFPNRADAEEERQRRRALVEMSNSNGHTRAESTKLDRRGSKRVFEGKHTRALSLLSPTSTKPASGRSIDELVGLAENRQSEDSASDHQPGTPSLSRMPTLDGLVSPENLQLGFGKTYTDLAGSKGPLPPGAADVFMKQGKQVVDGVREGLWTFFEDIRQATVGDEAVNGPVTQQRRPRPGKPHHPTRRKSKAGKASHNAVTKTDSFWGEFGLDTPKKNQRPRGESSTTKIPQKSSIDSRTPPDLLEDTRGNEIAEDWDNWESPSSARKRTQTEPTPLDTDGLPWPELKKLTPSKLNRTASDMMREWRNGDALGTIAAESPL